MPIVNALSALSLALLSFASLVANLGAVAFALMARSGSPILIVLPIAHLALVGTCIFLLNKEKKAGATNVFAAVIVSLPAIYAVGILFVIYRILAAIAEKGIGQVLP